MIRLYNAQNNEMIGEITEAQLQFLVEQLEEESLEDQDYAITPLLLQYFESRNADPELVSLLRAALSGPEVVESAWSSGQAGAS